MLRSRFCSFCQKVKILKGRFRICFASLEEIRGTQVFQLVFEDGEKRYHYQIRISALLDDENKVFQCVGLAENITEQLVMRQEIEIFRQKAGTDYLTGLYNRGKGTELITELLNNMDPETESHAFIILDLDNFKGLNDTLGHQTGDAALQDVASILQRHFRNYDIICRLAGDEFVVLINNIPEEIVQKNLEILLRKAESFIWTGKNSSDFSFHWSSYGSQRWKRFSDSVPKSR